MTPEFDPQQIGKRVQALASENGGQKGLATLSGVPESTVSRIANGGGGNLESFAKIAVAARRSLDWLVFGADGDITFPAPDRQIAQGMALPGDGDLIAGDFALVPRYEVRASAGGGAVVESENVIERVAYRLDWITSQRLDPDWLMVTQADGDSMEPTISDGDLLLVDRRASAPRSEGIYFMRLGEGLVVKRVQLTANGGAKLISDNTRYPPEVLTRDQLGELEFLGRVRWRGGRL